MFRSILLRPNMDPCWVFRHNLRSWEINNIGRTWKIRYLQNVLCLSVYDCPAPGDCVSMLISSCHLQFKNLDSRFRRPRSGVRNPVVGRAMGIKIIQVGRLGLRRKVRKNGGREGLWKRVCSYCGGQERGGGEGEWKREGKAKERRERQTGRQRQTKTKRDREKQQAQGSHSLPSKAYP